MMAEVVLDDQIFQLQPRGGISRYHVELLLNLPQVDPGLVMRFPTRWTLNEHAIEAGLARRIPGVPESRDAAFGRQAEVARRLLRVLGTPVPRVRHGRRLVHHPTYTDKRRFLPIDAPLVVTVHDMIPELFPGLFPTNPHLDKDWYVRRADAIIAVSQATADDLVALYPWVTAPIHVVHHGVSTREFCPHGVTTDAFPGPWALFVGGRGGYKDFGVLLHALRLQDATPVHLVVAGGGPPAATESRLIQDLGLTGRVTFVPARDVRLAQLYRSTDVFVFPSRYEGFGLPTLEAMSCGAPVVLARSSAHPEVGGSEAVYFSPGDAKELAAAIEAVVEDPSSRARRHHASVARARRFTWIETARRTADVYRASL